MSDLSEALSRMCLSMVHFEYEPRSDTILAIHGRHLCRVPAAHAEAAILEGIVMVKMLFGIGMNEDDANAPTSLEILTYAQLTGPHVTDAVR